MLTGSNYIKDRLGFLSALLTFVHRVMSCLELFFLWPFAARLNCERWGINSQSLFCAKEPAKVQLELTSELAKPSSYLPKFCCFSHKNPLFVSLQMLLRRNAKDCGLHYNCISSGPVSTDGINTATNNSAYVCHETKRKKKEKSKP